MRGNTDKIILAVLVGILIYQFINESRHFSPTVTLVIGKADNPPTLESCISGISEDYKVLLYNSSLSIDEPDMVITCEDLRDISKKEVR
jgi:hypothetical protein